MDQDINSGDRPVELFAKIHEGMEVVDRAGKRIGTVERVHFGNAGEGSQSSTVRPPSNEAGRVPADTGFGEVLENVFDPTDQIEDAVQKELLEGGFIRLAGAPSAYTRYIRPEQISSVSGDRVTLGI